MSSLIGVVSLLTDQFFWWDHSAGRWERQNPLKDIDAPTSVVVVRRHQFNSTEERRNADIGLFAKSARDEHEHHKLNTKAQMGTKTKTTNGEIEISY